MQKKEIDKLKNEIENILSDNKAIEINSINLENKSSIADFMIVASGTSSRHIQALSEILINKLKEKGIDNCRLEGRNSDDWKLGLFQDDKVLFKGSFSFIISLTDFII